MGIKLSEAAKVALKLSQPKRIEIVITDLETDIVSHHTSIREAAKSPWYSKIYGF